MAGHSPVPCLACSGVLFRYGCRSVSRRGSGHATSLAAAGPGIDGPRLDDMASRVEAVIFDADGTLLDSLPPHVAFCRRANVVHSAGLDGMLPDLGDLPGMRAIAAAPMDNFLRRAGFPEDLVGVLNAEYQATFATDFPVQPFAGVPAMLGNLSDTGVSLAVVSSNTEGNVRRGLGAPCSHFRFVLGIDNAASSKVDSIAEALGLLSVSADQALYVGDTLKDCECAMANGVRFVGAGYGFEDLEAEAARGSLGGTVGIAACVQDLRAILLREIGSRQS